MKAGTRELFAHVALALARYEREARSDGQVVPPELAALRVFVTDCAQRRPDATPEGRLDPVRDSEVMHANPLLSRRETATALRCSTRTVDRLIARGELLGVKVEGSTKVRHADLDAYIAGLPPRSFREQVIEKGTAC